MASRLRAPGVGAGSEKLILGKDDPFGVDGQTHHLPSNLVEDVQAGGRPQLVTPSSRDLAPTIWCGLGSSGLDKTARGARPARSRVTRRPGMPQTVPRTGPQDRAGAPRLKPGAGGMVSVIHCSLHSRVRPTTAVCCSAPPRVAGCAPKDERAAGLLATRVYRKPWRQRLEAHNGNPSRAMRRCDRVTGPHAVRPTSGRRAGPRRGGAGG